MQLTAYVSLQGVQLKSKGDLPEEAVKPVPTVGMPLRPTGLLCWFESFNPYQMSGPDNTYHCNHTLGHHNKHGSASLALFAMYFCLNQVLSKLSADSKGQAMPHFSYLS